MWIKMWDITLNLYICFILQSNRRAEMKNISNLLIESSLRSLKWLVKNEYKAQNYSCSGLVLGGPLAYNSMLNVEKFKLQIIQYSNDTWSSSKIRNASLSQIAVQEIINQKLIIVGIKPIQYSFFANIVINLILHTILRNLNWYRNSSKNY